MFENSLFIPSTSFVKFAEANQSPQGGTVFAWQPYFHFLCVMPGVRIVALRLALLTSKFSELTLL